LAADGSDRIMARRLA